MVSFDLFGPWGQILLIFTGAMAVLFGILMFACFFTPGCIGHECTQKRRKKAECAPPSLDGTENGNGKLADSSYRSWRLGSLYEDGNNGVINKTDTLEKYSIGTISENSELRVTPSNLNDQFGSIDTSSTLHLIRSEKQKADKKLKECPTELTISLQYLPPCNEIITGKLVIGVEALNSLPPKQYNCTLEPYVVLNIMKQSWSLRKRRKLHSFRTRGIRHTASPIYKETFVVPDVKASEVKEWVLDFSAFDNDRYANHTELCSLKVPLKEVKEIFKNPEIHLYNYKMKPSDQEFGNILLGISHLPTAKRLTINIMKLRNINFTNVLQSPEEFNPYVKVLMLNAKTGRKLQKKRTRFLHAVTQPEFNETLTFDLAFNQLDTLQFLIVLCSKIIKEDYSGSSMEHPSDSEDSINSFRRQKDLCIGKVALGRGVRDLTEKLHWFSVCNNPRKLITVWHTLK